jgi:hypothetical protein
LHHVVRELGLKPIVYTYDWGMNTDTGTANVKRMCRIFDLQRIDDVVPTKRIYANLRKNLSAWLKRPDPGMIPLFLAADKPFFWRARKASKNLGLETVFFGMHNLEAEDFKEEFCGVKPADRAPETLHYALGFYQKLRVLLHYGSQFAANPRYINGSLVDTAYSFFCYYLLPHDYFFNLFSSIEWNEDIVVKTLVDEYGWRREPDTTSSWRTGDLASAFTGYLYLQTTGFTEIDFFRSNQVRRGILSRDEALKRVMEENVPRIPSVREFCRRIGMNADDVISAVEKIKQQSRVRYVGAHEREQYEST